MERARVKDPLEAIAHVIGFVVFVMALQIILGALRIPAREFSAGSWVALLIAAGCAVLGGRMALP